MNINQEQLAQLARLVNSAWHLHGADTPLDGLILTRAEHPSGLMHALYQPSFCVVLQGRKSTQLTLQQFDYAAGECLLAAVNVPVSSRITTASPEQPYLALSLALQPSEVTELLLSDTPPEASHANKRSAALQVAQLPVALVDPLSRLLRLLDEPADLPVLAPLIRRELIWRLLRSPLGERLRHLGQADGDIARIGVTTAWIRTHYRQAFKVADLAAQVAMSEPTFYRHFKAITQLTPIQFQKQVRLHHARRLLAAGSDSADAAFAVGYESPSQFSREYRRLFGAPPGQDKILIRSQAAIETLASTEFSN